MIKKIGSALLVVLLLGVSSFAATATPISVAGVAVAGSTLTVTTATAHGLSATLPSGFCISGSSAAADNVCGVVATTPTVTTFTFTLVGGAACASSCGTVLPAKRIIWLNTQVVHGGYQVVYLLWLTTTAPVGARASSWTGAVSAENNALSTGLFIEVSRSQFFPAGTSLANAESFMVGDWTAQQNALASSVQPGAFFGNFYDGVGWVQ